MGLWNCQSAVNKADLISAFSLQSTLSILGLTETWIHPEGSATPAALSNNFSFSHTPLLKKPTLNTSLIDGYRPVFLLPIIAKTLERVVFNQVSLFLSQNNKLDANQSGFRSGHSTEYVLLSVTEALRIAKADS